MEAQVSDQVGVDDAFDDVPVVAVALQPIVKPSRVDRRER
jgi:hypothetical protein